MPTPSQYLNTVSVIIITGGSSGIGCSIIKAILKLAPDVRICNLSRSKPGENLDKIRHFPVDLTSATELELVAERLLSEISSASPGRVLLFNNSGFGDYGKAASLERCKQLSMIDLNIRAVVDLTHRLLPVLLERGGAVINIASIAGFQPTPYLATYGATKAFVLNWSLALDEDLRGSGVRALAVCPGPTRSNFFKAAGFERPPLGAGGSFDMTAEAVADQTLWALSRGRSLVVTGWKNKLIAFFGAVGPKRLVTRIGGRILRKMRLESGKGAQ